MIEKCSDEKIIYDYIGGDFGKCLYLFIDLVQYGLDKDYFTIWLQINENNEISSLISRYYDGFQIFSKNNEFDEKEIVGFIKKYDFSMIVGMEDTLRKISPMFSEFSLETGYVGQFAGLRTPPDPEAYRASADEIKALVQEMKNEVQEVKNQVQEVKNMIAELKNVIFELNFDLKKVLE